jgi:hypothetical protein
MSAQLPVSINEPPVDTPAGPADDERGGEPLHVKRNSIFPLLVDLGAVCAGFGLIIGMPLWGQFVGGAMMTVGITVAVGGLIGWWIEARKDFRRMPD